MTNLTTLNPDALEAAADAVIDASFGQELPEAPIDLATAAVSAYLAAVLPEVTSVEQWDALPDKIVLEDRRGTIWQKINGTWYTPGSKHDYSDQSVMLPARVLYRPGANDA